VKPLQFIFLGVLFELLLGCGAVPHANSKCVADFRNDTQGVLSDSELAAAWSHAQQEIAKGGWVVNAIDCMDPNIPCQFHAPDSRALSMKPECLGVRGTTGQPYPGAAGVTDDSHNIAIRIDEGHDRTWALATYEMGNCLGMRLGFPMGNR
jgi:hypothetical protein